MTTALADLEARVRDLESRTQRSEFRTQRSEEDITALVGTIVETRDDVKWLKLAVQALLDHNGIAVHRTPGDES